MKKIFGALEKWNLPTNWANGVKPSLYFDFVYKKYLLGTNTLYQAPIPTTTTVGMQFNNRGELVFAPHNFCTRGQDLSSWSMGGDGTVTVSSEKSPVLTDAYEIVWTTPTPTAGLAMGNQNCILGATHTVSCYLKYVNTQWARIVLYSSANTTNQVRIWVDLQNMVAGTASASGTATFTSASVSKTSNGFVKVTLTGKVPFTSATTDANILIASAVSDGSTTRVGNGASLIASNVIFEATSISSPQQWQPEFNTSGSSWYGPRYDHDPATGTPLGLLIEPSKTNLLTNSLGLTNATVAVLASSIANSSQTYLGGWSAVTLTADGTSAAHAGYPGSLTPSASSTIWLTAIVKPVSGGTFYQLTGSGNWLLDLNGYVNFNLTGSGSITATGSSAQNPSIRHLGNGVYWISCGLSTSAAPTSGAVCIVSPIMTGADTRLLANTSTASFEYIYASASTVPATASVIPSFQTSQTKGADTLTVALGSWFDSTKGTFLTKFIRAQVNTGTGTSGTMFSLYSDTSNYIGVISGSGTNSQHRIDTISAGSPQAQIQTSVGSTAFTERTVVGTYDTNLFRGVENGGTVATDNLGTVPTVTTLGVGVGPAGGQIDGWIKEIRYYPDDSSTDTQLQSLSA